jgi:modulator of FtsH protease HflC
MNNRLGLTLVVVVVLLVLASLSAFTVDERQHAIVFQLGEIKEIIVTQRDKNGEPVVNRSGLHFKLPLIQNVRYLDNRILTLDTPDTERFITKEKKNVLVDSFVKWRIEDVKQYYISVGADEQRAQLRIAQTINAALREEFGKRTIQDVVAGERDEIMQVVRQKVDEDVARIGVEIVDVRLKRVDLPAEVSESVYRRMKAERESVASQLRSQGFSEAEKIKAEAERDREVIIAEAYRAAQRVKGEGDARASAIYARAFGDNPEFYAFYRSMEAYRSTFRGRNDVLVIEPTAEFFRYFKNPGRGGRGEGLPNK